MSHALLNRVMVIVACKKTIGWVEDEAVIRASAPRPLFLWWQDRRRLDSFTFDKGAEKRARDLLALAEASNDDNITVSVEDFAAISEWWG